MTKTSPADHELPATTGDVFRPGDPGYDTEIAGFQTSYTHRPAVVVAAVHTEDVRAAVEYAARHDLPIAVQATGHGLSVASDGGVLINTSRLTDIRVDAAARTARVGAGVRAGQLIEAAAAHGLAPLNGSALSVGVVGYTLGGGIGILAREFGYAAEHVHAVEVVTADGRLRRLTPGDELFGAILGSGGNFGVVTALEVALLPITTVYGGQLQFDAENVPAALEAWRQWTADVPEELSSAITMLIFPDLPQVPEHLRGKYTATINVAYTGSFEDGERLVAPLRAVGPRMADDLRAMPYTESHGIYREPDYPHPYAATNALLPELSADVAADFRQLTGPDSPVPIVAGFKHLGGALSRPGPNDIAVDHRDAQYVARALSSPGPDNADAVHDQLDVIRKSLSEQETGLVQNFLYGGGEQADEAQTRELYTPATYDRLAALKAKYDPANLFRNNRNIRPR